ncbi:MAG: hypothetical protein AB8C95_12445 [Phycisphaeraceae bacterium]
MNTYLRQACLMIGLLVTLAVGTSPVHAEASRFEAADSEGVTASRDRTTLYLQVDAEVKGPISIPRLAAPLRSMAWEGMEADSGLTLKPKPDTWEISWKARPAEASKLVLSFDAPPLLMSEIKPIEATGDGSFYIPAHLAVTRGEKIRYEPQPSKNTVGFWVDGADFAVWTIHLEKPGRFKVAVLQGCGRGQGGSKASIWFHRWLDQGRVVPEPEMKLDFDVLETGHFQSFQWVHIGEAVLTQPGDTRIEVSPETIKKAALMDIRAIHLIRLPDKKK